MATKTLITMSSVEPKSQLWQIRKKNPAFVITLTGYSYTVSSKNEPKCQLSKFINKVTATQEAQEHMSYPWN